MLLLPSLHGLHYEVLNRFRVSSWIFDGGNQVLQSNFKAGETRKFQASPQKPQLDPCPISQSCPCGPISPARTHKDSVERTYQEAWNQGSEALSSWASQVAPTLLLHPSVSLCSDAKHDYSQASAFGHRYQQTIS